MMILVSISRRSGMFQYLAVWSAQAAKAHPAGILFILQITTAVVSAFLDNVTTVLLIVPVTLAICKTLKAPAYPYLFAEIIASNIGGTATLIGDPPNILIGSQAGLSFNEFVYHLTPVIIIVMVMQQRHTDRRLGQFDRSWDRRSQRGAVPLHHLYAVRLPDDGGACSDLPCLCLVAVFLEPSQIRYRPRNLSCARTLYHAASRRSAKREQ